MFCINYQFSYITQDKLFLTKLEKFGNCYSKAEKLRDKYSIYIRDFAFTVPLCIGTPSSLKAAS